MKFVKRSAVPVFLSNPGSLKKELSDLRAEIDGIRFFRFDRLNWLNWVIYEVFVEWSILHTWFMNLVALESQKSMRLKVFRKKNNYSKTSLMWTPLGLFETVHINRAITLEGVNAKRYNCTFSMRSLLITVIRFIYWMIIAVIWSQYLFTSLSVRCPEISARYSRHRFHVIDDLPLFWGIWIQKNISELRL